MPGGDALAGSPGPVSRPVWMASTGGAGLVGSALPIAALGSVVALLLALPLARMPMSLPVDFGEGWNAYMADAASVGRALYAPSGSLTPNNYPPLSFYLVGWLHGVTGIPSLMLGRGLSLLALVVVGLEVAWVARLSGAGSAQAWFGALALVGLVGAASPRYVAMNDPQWLAHALGTLALVLYLRWPIRRHRGSLPLMAVITAVALFTKHNLVALPLALSVDIAINTRRLLSRWGLLAGGVALGLGAWLESQAHGLMLANILTPRRYDLWSLLTVSGVAIAAMCVPAAVSMGTLVGRRAESHVRLIATYFAISVVTGVIFAGGSGADVNMFFDAFIALSIGLALALSAADGRPMPIPATALSIAAWLGLALILRMPTPARIEALRQREIDTLTDVAFVRDHAGQAFCEQMLVCYSAGKPLVLQPYFAPELIAAGAVPAATVSRLFEQHAFSVVQLDRVIDDAPGSSARSGTIAAPRRRLTPDVLAAIQQHYRLARTSANGAFYVPTTEGLLWGGGLP